MRETPDFPKLVEQAKKDLEELKRRQFAGSSNVQVHETQTADTWDIDTTINLIAPFYNGAYAFYFIADNQVAPLAEFHPRILIDGVESTANDFKFMGQTGFDINTVGIDTDDFTKLTGADYTMNGENSAVSFHLQVKMTVRANDTGTIVVKRLS